jgi:hypothetical protein
VSVGEEEEDCRAERETIEGGAIGSMGYNHKRG